MTDQALTRLEELPASLSRVFTWAYESGRRSSNPAGNLPRVRVPSSIPRPTPEIVIRDAVLGASPAVRLMLLLGSLQGLRRAEIAGLRIEDFTESDVRVVGKGGRERLVPIHPALRSELAAYLERTHIGSGWLFPNRGGSDHLSIQWVGSRCLAGSPPDGPRTSYDTGSQAAPTPAPSTSDPFRSSSDIARRR